ncbi:sigma-70 family RNA polymerase sigma factor [Bacillus thuringiensis]|uniref:sigma-70 family RNA polymerase sigma factor n=1 Tax=Bacillus thuringiensis TaxID=1428 RepID=UPI000E535419|nr:sigma-70 family RNA polymerase sigma factor [Bacillus thuringiensis]MDZ3957034.1 sigma-70 family RNA polymerase sigma factor [Bacillus thuringiensis]RGP42983.1 hypothetical protein BTW32_30420 [Bacillus thuringiensis]
MPVEGKLKSFFELNRVALEQPIMKDFLSINENRELFFESILDPNNKNNELLDYKFKLFFKRCVIIKYINTLIRIYSIDFDKRVRKNRERYLLILDKPIQSESNDISTTMIDMIKTPESNETSNFVFENRTELKDVIKDPKLYKALNELTEKQYAILELIYIRGFNNKEVATLFNESPQNISNIHKKTLRKLKKSLID